MRLGVRYRPPCHGVITEACGPEVHAVEHQIEWLVRGREDLNERRIRDTHSGKGERKIALGVIPSENPHVRAIELDR